MPTMRVVYNQVTKVALVQLEATAIPSGSVNAGTFEHPTPDGLGPNVNHVLFHHVRDLLYKIGVQDMQSTRIDVALTAQTVSLQAIHVTPADVAVAVNGTQQLTVAFVPTNATDKSVIYESSKPTIATVSATGLVTGKKAGTATIAVASGDKMDTVEIKVT